VYYGCANDKFGGCGSILSLHQTDSEKMFRYMEVRLYCLVHIFLFSNLITPLKHYHDVICYIFIFDYFKGSHHS